MAAGAEIVPASFAVVCADSSLEGPEAEEMGENVYLGLMAAILPPMSRNPFDERDG